jgi:CHAT domain-containing protein
MPGRARTSAGPARGKLYRGVGLLGLTRAFLQAGAQSTLVTLWSIEDSAADFMDIFYENVRECEQGPSTGWALRDAKLRYIERSIPLPGNERLSLSQSFFWAPFVLTSTSTDQVHNALQKKIRGPEEFSGRAFPFCAKMTA